MVAIVITKATAPLIPKAVSIFFETPRKGQIPKNLWTENQEGEKIKLVRTLTDNEEGKFVADTIQEQKLRNHYYNKDFAILYRTNAQSRSFEESLRKMGIAYRIYGGVSFYQRKEIKK